MNLINTERQPVHRLLVCVDLQLNPRARRAASARAQACIANCRRLLRHARDEDWSIVHSYRRAGEGKLTPPPLPGLEPRLSEAVMPRAGISAFSNRSLQWLVEGARDAQLVLAGFCLGPTGLATLFSAHDLDLPAIIVRDAVCPEDRAGESDEAAEAVIWNMAAPLAASASTDRLIGAAPVLRLVSVTR